ncbi:dipeptidase PepV [Litchfieldia alkalitelluris]|uniref:dipeptidase PepV n=1 Tax=Litchfieldia alkalitelluris TaxID=304268 RepID=UPI0009978032|nr:dipeptidase PepV [Litchfieldia alkalitelluris]
MNNWYELVEKQQHEIISDTQEFLRINSVLDEGTITSNAPFGKGINEALTFLLSKGTEQGFTAKNVDGYAGHLEIGKGEEIVGILCHVDVVPEGDGWQSAPFDAEIRDGKIFARGAIDDKGPTMAAFYAMKIVNDLKLPLTKRVRMIIGTDEESNWQCVDHYFKHEEMPTLGFAPDADFPIIYAEKGIVDFDLIQIEQECEKVVTNNSVLVSFQSGRRYNMVPDFAEAKLNVAGEQTSFIEQFNEYLNRYQLRGKAILEDTVCVLHLEGKSAHAMEPNHGKNAALYLSQFLSNYEWDSKADQFLRLISSYFLNDSRGKALGIEYSDDISGELTVNVGKVSYSQEDGGVLGLNMRYPVTADIDLIKQQIEKVAEKQQFSLSHFSNSKPHHVNQDDFLIRVLQKVYEEQTGEEAKLISIGGGTYARSLKSGVAFGPLFPRREDSAHQKDEHIYIEDLLKATAIYAQAIYELAK